MTSAINIINRLAMVAAPSRWIFLSLLLWWVSCKARHALADFSGAGVINCTGTLFYATLFLLSAQR